MLERIHEYFYSEPGRITGHGRLICQLGAFLLVVGAIGRVVTTAINISPTIAKQPETTKMLAEVYPALPLWWVPETWYSAIACILLIVGGLCLNAHGKQVERMGK